MNSSDVWGKGLLKNNVELRESTQVSFKLSEKAYSCLSKKQPGILKRKLREAENDPPQPDATTQNRNPILDKILGRSRGKETPYVGDLGIQVDVDHPFKDESTNTTGRTDLRENPVDLKSPSKLHLKKCDQLLTSEVFKFSSQRHKAPIVLQNITDNITNNSFHAPHSDIPQSDFGEFSCPEPPAKRSCHVASSFQEQAVGHNTQTATASCGVVERISVYNISANVPARASMTYILVSDSKPMRTDKTAAVKPEKVKTDNFVKINLRKKCFVKGPGKFNSKQKRWQSKMSNRNKSRYENANEVRFKNNGPKLATDVSQAVDNFGVGVPSPVPDVLRDFILETSKKSLCYTSPTCEKVTVDPNDVCGLIESSLKIFKINRLRDWQRAAINVVLSGESSLVVKPTGSGKSLCYLIPAFIFHKQYQYITLVVSPLISLMDDQVKNLPRGMKGAAFHSGLTDAKRKAVLKELQEKKVAVLYVSPETLVEGVLLKVIAEFPPIAFACIDEVHCVSQWSHNFRPTYFRVCTVLRQQFGISCILGSTATASLKTMQSIAELLNVKEESMFYDVCLPQNLKLTASHDTHRLQALCDLLENNPFHTFKSILIYCTKRIDCERVASHLRSYFSDQNIAESYHAGKSSSERSKIQKNFMNDTLRVVCATVAFGMGLDKSALRAVIHYNISQGIESYVQEIGRAGRSTNLESYCHTFLGNNSMLDLYEQERHIYSNFVEPFTIRKIVNMFFEDCNTFECSVDPISHYHYHAIDLSKAAEFDIKEEVLLTYVSYLEMHSSNILSVERAANNWCNVYFYKGFDIDKKFFQECLPIKIALKLSESGGKFAYRKGNKLRFQLTAIANHCDLSISQINYRLFTCQTKDLGIKVQFEGRSIIYRTLCDIGDRVGELTDYILDLSKRHETDKLSSLHTLFNEVLLPISETSAMRSVSKASDCEIPNSLPVDCIARYFNSDVIRDREPSLDEVSENEEHVARQSIRAFLSLYQDMNVSGLVVCRILQGIDSPQYPSQTWYTVARFWKSCIAISFSRLLQICNDEVLKA